MLQALLTEIQKGGPLNPTVLASRLDVSPDLVTLMLEDLERRGLLARLPQSCSSSACQGCPVATTCGPSDKSSRVWSLVLKTS